MGIKSKFRKLDPNRVKLFHIPTVNRNKDLKKSIKSILLSKSKLVIFN